MAKKTVLEQRIRELDTLRAKGTITEDEYAARRNALLSDTSVGAAPAKSGGGLFKWGFLGCLGIFAALGIFVVVVIVAIVAAIGDSADKAADSGGDVHVAFAANASGTIAPEGNGSKKSTVTILETADNPPGSLLKPAAGKKYWAVKVRVENTGTKEVSSLDWKLRDTLNNEHDRTFLSGIGENLEVIYSDLTPGGRVEGWVVFEIPAEAGPKWLRADPNPFLAHDLYFDVQ